MAREQTFPIFLKKILFIFSVCTHLFYAEDIPDWLMPKTLPDDYNLNIYDHKKVDKKTIDKFQELENSKIKDANLSYEYAEYLEDKNLNKSIQWYKISAQAGNTDAVRFLAKYYWDLGYSRKKKLLMETYENEVVKYNTLLLSIKDSIAIARLLHIYKLKSNKEKLFLRNVKELVKYVNNEMFSYKEVRKDKYYIDIRESLIYCFDQGWIENYKLIYDIADSLYYSLKEKDEKHFFAMLKYIAEKGYYEAQKLLAEKYYFSKDKHDWEKSLYYYKQILNKQYTSDVLKRIEKLSVRLENKDKIKILSKLSKFGNYDATFELAKLYENGSKEYNITKNDKKALKLYTSAAKSMHIQSMKKLSKIYKYGYIDVKKDSNLSQYWFFKANKIEAQQEGYREKVISLIQDRKIDDLKQKMKGNDYFSYDFICHTVKDGSLDILKIILLKFPNVNLNQECKKSFNTDAYALLPLASMMEQEYIIDFLLKNGVSRRIDRALKIALYIGNSAIIDKLINSGIKLDIDYEAAAAKDRNYYILKNNSVFSNKAFYSALQHNTYKNFKHIANTKVSFNPDYFVTPPLQPYKYFKLMLDKKVNIENKFFFLGALVRTEQYELLDLAFKNGFSSDEKLIDEKYSSSWSLLEYAKTSKMKKIILKHMSKDSKKFLFLNEGGNLSALVNDIEVYKNIISSIDNINDIDSCGVNALMKNRNIDIGMDLINRGIKLNQESLATKSCIERYDFPKDALTHFLLNELKVERTLKDLKLVNLFLDNGIDINYTTPIVPLSYAHKNAEVWFKNNGFMGTYIGGDTYLHSIIFNGKLSKIDFQIIRLFLDQGIDINKKNAMGFTVLKLAVYIDNLDVVKLLLKYGAKPDLDILKYIVNNNQIDIFTYIIKNIDVSIFVLKQSLILTSEFGSFNMSKVVLETMQEKNMTIIPDSPMVKKILKNAKENRLGFLVEQLKKVYK